MGISPGFLYVALSIVTLFQVNQAIESFVIVFQGSQGSSFLIEMLAQLQDICIVGYEPLGEVSGDTAIKKLKRLLYPGNFSFNKYKSNIEKLVDSREHFDKCNGNELIYGLKARLSAYTLRALLNSPSFSHTKFIILQRNMIKQAVGTYRRKHCGLGQFELRMKLEQKKSPEEIENFKNRKCNVQLAPLRSLCLHYWKQHNANKNFLEGKGRVMSVSYEDIMTNVTAAIDNKIAPFVGARLARKFYRPPSLQKASPDLLCRSIENFDAVCGMVRADLPAPFMSWMNADSCKSRNSNMQPGLDCCPVC